jgi:hypothetical protein
MRKMLYDGFGITLVKTAMKKDREKRTAMKLPLQVWGMDANGQVFRCEAHTLDITPVGARIEGPLPALQRGSLIGVQCGNSKARFRVVWIDSRTPRHRRLGIRCTEPGKYIWGVWLKREMEDLRVKDQTPEPALT